MDESVGTIYFDVTRSLGSTDTVTVDLVTIAATAHAQTGADIVVTQIDEVKTTSLVQPRSDSNQQM